MRCVLMIEEHELDEEGIDEQAEQILDEIRDKMEADYPEITEYEVVRDD